LTSNIARNRLSSAFSGGLSRIEQYPMLVTMMGAFCESAAAAFANIAGAPKIQLDELSARRAQDSMAIEAQTGLYFPVRSEALAGQLVFCFGQDLIFNLTDSALGGSGQARPAFDRRPTPIETRIATMFAEAMVGALQLAFAKAEIEADLTIETPTHLAQTVPLLKENVPVVAASVSIAFGPIGALGLILIPQSVLGPYRDKLARTPVEAPPPRRRAADPGWSEQIQQELSRTTVSITTILEERTLTLDEIVHLKVGQVLELTATATSRVRMESDNVPLFWCDLGRQGTALALRVQGPIDRDQEFFDELVKS
jgi:flagellar motor switch protein FliM